MRDISDGLIMGPRGDDLPELEPEERSRILQRLERIPIFHTLGFEQVRIGRGWFDCVAPRDPKYDGIFESFHGGLLMTVADSAAAIVSLTIWGSDARITTTDMNIRFLAPARSAVRVFAQTIKQGRTLAPVAANLWRDDGTLVAVAQVTYMRLVDAT